MGGGFCSLGFSTVVVWVQGANILGTVAHCDWAADLVRRARHNLLVTPAPESPLSHSQPLTSKVADDFFHHTGARVLAAPWGLNFGR